MPAGRVRLIFRSISEVVGTEQIGLLILTDEQETRQLAIPCDRAMLSQFRMRLNRLPVVSRMLPEVLWQVILTQTHFTFEIMIAGIIDGQYRALLLNNEAQELVAIRASDAILLSHIARVPIYIDEDLLQKQSVPYEREAKGVAIPLNTISTEMLRSALDRAVEEEKYELASHLRDELNRRKQS